MVSYVQLHVLLRAAARLPSRFLLFFFTLVDLIGRLAMFSSVTLSLLENQS